MTHTDTAGLVERLREGCCIVPEKHSPYEIDEDATDVLMREAADLIEAQSATIASLQERERGAREKALEEARIGVVKKLNSYAAEWLEDNGVRAETYRWAANHADKYIRTLKDNANGK